jgi:hypothetical protein
MPGDPNVRDWTEYAAAMKKRYGDSLQKLQERDRNLGEWFDGVDNDSTYEFFMNKYDDEAGKLQAELLEKGILIGSPKVDESKSTETNHPGFNWLQRTEILAKSTDEARQVKELLQKRFNISRAVANAVSAGFDKATQRPRRLLDVTFLEKFKFAPPGAAFAPPDAKNMGIAIDYKRYVGYVGVGSGSYAEQELPKNGYEPPGVGEAPPGKELHLGRTLTFGFSVVMDYPYVAEVLRTLVSGEVEPVLNLAIVGMNVFVAEPNPAEKKEIYVLKSGETEDEVKARFAKVSQEGKPPQVHVYVTCQVYDLEPASVPAFLKP